MELKTLIQKFLSDAKDYIQKAKSLRAAMATWILSMLTAVALVIFTTLAEDPNLLWIHLSDLGILLIVAVGVYIVIGATDILLLKLKLEWDIKNGND